MKEDRPNSGAGSKTDWRGLFLLSQLGVSILIPPLVFFWGAYWLTQHKGVGYWIYLPALILGIGTAFSSAKRLVTPLLRPRTAQRDETDRTDRR